MLKLGIILTAATVTILVVEFFRARRWPFPAHGWLGLAALVGAEFLMFHGIEPAAINRPTRDPVIEQHDLQIYGPCQPHT